MQMVSTFQVTNRRRNSKASYVNGVEVGDIIRAEMEFYPAKKHGKGNYAFIVELYKYDGSGDYTDSYAYERVGSTTQNEFFKGYYECEEDEKEQHDEDHKHDNNFQPPVFCIQEL